MENAIEIEKLSQLGRIEEEIEVIKDQLKVKLHTLTNKQQEEISDSLSFTKEQANEALPNLAAIQKKVLIKAITSINSNNYSEKELESVLSNMQSSAVSSIYIKYLDLIDKQNKTTEEIKKN